MPTMSVTGSAPPTSPRTSLRPSYATAIAVIGVAMRKQNRAASARSRPANSAADIEMPDRLTPGISARACAKPIPRRPAEREPVQRVGARPEPVGEPQDDAADHEHHRHDAGLADVLLDDVVEEEGDDRGGDRRQRR